MLAKQDSTNNSATAELKGNVEVNKKVELAQRLDSKKGGAVRSAGVDFARVCAAAGIIWIHASNGTEKEWARPALSFFVAAIGYFGWNQVCKSQDPRGYVRSRLPRLLIPFVVWSAIHGALFGVRMLTGGKAPVHLPEWGPLFGTNYHLWFLPFAAAMACLLALGYALLGPDRKRQLIILSTFAAVTLVIGSQVDWLAVFYNPRQLRPLIAWMLELPTFALAVAFAAGTDPQNPPGLAWGIPLLLGCILLKLILPPDPAYYAVNSLCGVACLIAALGVRKPTNHQLATLAKLSFFVYLLHLIPLSAIRSLVAHLPVDGLLAVAVLTLLTWVASNLIGLVGLRLGMKWPLLP